MRADRLLSILMNLQTFGRMTAGALAERLEVSERTIYRDMEALCMAGIPLVAERGNGGGWYLPEGYRTQLTMLNAAEMQAMFLSQPDTILDDLGWQQASQAALIKLLATLPDRSRRDAEFVRQRIHIDGAGWRSAKEDIQHLPTLQEAIWQDKQVKIIYGRSDGAERERIIHPLGLVVKSSIWYMVGAVEGEIRNYRVSRIQSTQILDAPCTRPAGFDLATYWEESTAEFMSTLPTYPAVLRVTDKGLAWARSWRYARIQQIEADDREGWQRVMVNFQFVDEAANYVLSGGTDVQVITPDELREQLIKVAQAVLEQVRIEP